MDSEHQAEILGALRQLMAARASTRMRLDELTQEFAARLFTGLARALDELETQGIPGLGKYRRLKVPDGSREAFQIFVEDWSILFVPLSGTARPNALDEARISGAQFKEPAGRIAAFLSDDPQASAFYDFLIFRDGAWFAWGYGWPRQQDDIEHTDFEALAWELIYSFAKDIFTTWQVRAETTLGAALDKKRRAWTLGLPGDERRA